ncbi:LAME_0D02586g1_1 [Lachancea meyersii CBS 8951]|uniref:Chromatin modification-related protein EAF1 n=1 Tax=Lachancea meyersii CBS 8951 TaxID=1266667 RepID=A0A1G4J7Z2_9SACH|nr:LAME_0D02586g1_1 [Lachancea meyersii CBS 8951]
MTKFDKKNATDDGTKLEQLIAERNRLIMELYCVSRIQDFLHITNEQELATEIREFLDVHDIRKGYRFDQNKLPRFSQIEPPSDKKPVKSKSSTPVDNSKRDKDSAKPDKEDHKTTSEKDKDATRDLKGKTVRDTQSRGKILQQTPKKEDRITVELEELDVSEATNDNVTSSRKRSREQETPQAIELSRELPEAQQLTPTTKEQEIFNNSKRQQTSSFLRDRDREPRSVNVKRTNHLIRELRQKGPQIKNLFHKGNINAKESVYLIMKDTVPSMIPHAVPLSELKFNSQTLPLIKLIPTAHKVLTSEIMNTALNECRIAVVSSRIEELRRQGLWSLRQPKKFTDPWDKLKDTESHRGHLLKEAKWMYYDFYEHTKYKRAVCLTIAQGVMDFWNYGKVCCVKTDPVNHLEPTQETLQRDEENSQTPQNDQPRTEIVSTQDRYSTSSPEVTEETSSTETIDISELLKRPDPSNDIQSLKLPEIDVNSYVRDKQTRPSPFKLHVSLDEFNHVERKIIDDLNVLSGTSDLEKAHEESFEVLFEPISKATVLLDDDHYLKIVERQIIDEEPSLVPFSKRRGMFYGNRRSHYLRPPIAPSLRYLRYRTPTIWLPQDDQELVRNINTYAYNWGLISAHMSSRPTRSYCSNIERRTPWQCFERFIQLNERFQFIDMKGPRAHHAQVWLIEAHKLQQQQKRRISPLGVGEESIQRGHKRLRWASMFEAMRKCIKKRENAPRPNPTQPRKPLDCKNTSVPTPAEMSQLKAQRDDALRRDIQIRRIAKQKLQAAALTQGLSPNGHARALPRTSPSSGQRRVVNNGVGANRGVSADSNMKITTQTPKQTQGTQYSKSTESQFRGIAIEQQCQQKPPTVRGEVLNNEPSSEKILSPTPQEILQKLQRGK